MMGLTSVGGESMSRVLVVANQTLASQEVADFVTSRMREGNPAFTLLVPATAQAHPEQSARLLGTIAGEVPRQDAVHQAEDAADYERARARVDSALETLRRLGASVDGVVGHPNPSKAIAEVLERRQFDEVVVFTLPRGVSRWLHLDLPHHIERKFRVPVTVMTAG